MTSRTQLLGVERQYEDTSLEASHIYESYDYYAAVIH